MGLGLRKLGAAAATAVALGSSVAVTGGAAQPRLGLFFDDQARQCAGVIYPFAEQATRVHVVAFPAGIPMTGAVFTLRLPVGLQLYGDLLFPKNLVWDYSGSLEDGLHVQFNDCKTTSDQVLVVSFDIRDVTFGDPTVPRPDLTLYLVGAATDSVASLAPEIGRCDPNNPRGNLGLVDATSLDAYLNCTRVCSCTAAIVPSAWAAIKSLYRER